MKYNKHILSKICIALYILCLVLIYPQGQAQAALSVPAMNCRVEEPAAHSSNQQLMQMMLRCDFDNVGVLGDSIKIINLDGRMAQGNDWHTSLGMNNDIWIFDHSSDNKPELLIYFHHTDQGAVAELYDVPPDADKVNYSIENNVLSVQNLGIPKVKVIAPEGWWTKGDLINYNIDIYVDGYVYATFGADNLKNIYRTDRKTDFIIHVRDTNQDGKPNYDWRTLFFEEPEPAIANITPKTYLAVNTKDNEAPITPVLPWPFLGSYSFGYAINGPHTTTPPPLQMDWSTGHISTIGEFVSSRGNDAQWFVYSFNELTKDEIGQPNFESPFGWYDLAEDHDRIPELAVRLVHYRPFDSYLLSGHFPYSLNNVRYSWDQNNDGFWDYKLGLLGQYATDEIVALPDLQMQTVPYQELPDWVIQRPWGAGIFVAADNVQAQGEGIYEWDAPAWLAEGYFAGYTDSATPPDAAADKKITTGDTHFTQILPGFRGEYQLNLNDKVSLYMSAIDHKLHLVHADKGMWNVNDTETMYYANLDGDKYLDQWRLQTTSGITQQLNIVPNNLIYSGEQQIVFKQTSAPMSLFETAPPANHAQWEALQHQVHIDPTLPAQTDLRQMFQQFPGPEQRITGAILHDLRVDASSFRLIMELLPGYSVSGASGLNLLGLQPGLYEVTYQGRFQIQPLQATNLLTTVSLPDGSTATGGQFMPTRITITNSSNQDALQMKLDVQALCGTNLIDILNRDLDVLAHETTNITASWQPKPEGACALHINLKDQDDQIVNQTTKEVVVAAAPLSSERSILSLSSGNGLRNWIPLMVLFIAGVVGLVIWLNQRSEKQGHN